MIRGTEFAVLFERTRCSVVAYVRAWLRACADGYSAGRTYEELRSLADAELTRRGLSRAKLAAQIFHSKEQRGREDRH